MGSIGLQGRAIGQSTLIPQHINAAKYGAYTYTTFLAQGTYLAATGYGPPVSPTAATVNLGFIPAEVGTSLPIVYSPINGPQTILAPVWNSTGLVVSGDLTDTLGVAYTLGAGADNVAKGKHVITVGVGQGSARVFFGKLTWKVADVSGVTTSFFGIRKVQAMQTTLTGYTDLAGCGLVTTDGNVTTRTRLNNGTAVVTDTGYNWADGETHTVLVEVYLDGKVRITYDTYIVLDRIFTFDAGDTVVPFFDLLHATTSPGAMTWTAFTAGWHANISVDAPPLA